MGSFWPCQSKKNTLSGSDRPVLPENALSGSDRLVLLENAFPVQNTPYLAQIGSLCLKRPSQSKMPCQSKKNFKTSLSEPDRVFFGLGSHFQAKRAYLSQISWFLGLTEPLQWCPARHFQAKRAYLSQIGCFFLDWQGISGKTSLSEPDKVFFWESFSQLRCSSGCRPSGEPTGMLL